LWEARGPLVWRGKRRGRHAQQKVGKNEWAREVEKYKKKPKQIRGGFSSDRGKQEERGTPLGRGQLQDSRKNKKKKKTNLISTRGNGVAIFFSPLGIRGGERKNGFPWASEKKKGMKQNRQNIDLLAVIAYHISDARIKGSRRMSDWRKNEGVKLR